MTPIDKKTASQKAAELLKKMTTEEKVDQLRSQLTFMPQYGERDYQVGHFRNIAHFMHHGKEAVVTPSECAAAINEDTRKSIEASPHGIPVLQDGEALHGAQWGNATCFPQAIGFAATFDPELISQIGVAVAKELRAVGVRQVFAPVINIARDCRWGRTEETYGEDTCLTSKIAVAYVKSLEENGIVTTPKHFVDNFADGGRDSNESHSSWRTLREVYLEPFRACVQEGGSRSIMTAYNLLDGVPCSASHKLLTQILREQWEFEGFVVSDYCAVNGIYSQHLMAETYAEAQAMALDAGLDVELHTGYQDILAMVKTGRISEEVLNQAVLRVLTVKYELGLFEEPFVDAKAADAVVRCPQHIALALEAARKAMVLLKNENHALPLQKKDYKTIGLFGPGANRVNVGGYSGPYGGWKNSDALTPLQALTQFMGNQAQVVCFEGDEDIETKAKGCDIALFFSATMEGEGTDRSSLKLPFQKVARQQSTEHAAIIGEKTFDDLVVNQEKIIYALLDSGTKTVLILLNGAPIDMEGWGDRAEAILETWYPGEQGSTAICETLFGLSNPGGKLPITFPKSIGQLPLYYNYKPSGRAYHYIENDGMPRYAFGYGLSYTTFEFSDFSIDYSHQSEPKATVSVSVTNTGTVKGDEVVQLYIQGRNCTVARPLKELKAFRRITLQPGETQRVVLTLEGRDFGYWNRELVFEIGHADYEIMLGNASDNILYRANIKVK